MDGGEDGRAGVLNMQGAGGMNENKMGRNYEGIMTLHVAGMRRHLAGGSHKSDGLRPLPGIMTG